MINEDEADSDVIVVEHLTPALITPDLLLPSHKISPSIRGLQERLQNIDNSAIETIEKDLDLCKTNVKSLALAVSGESNEDAFYRKARKLDLMCEELVTTEKNYLLILKTIQAIGNETASLPPDVQVRLKAVFSTPSSMVDVHQKLFDSFCKLRDEEGIRSVVKAFRDKRISGFLKIYKFYLSNFDAIMNAASCETDPSYKDLVNKVIQEVYQTEQVNLVDLPSMLSAVHARLTRLRMVMLRYLEHSEPDDCYRKDHEHGISVMNSILDASTNEMECNARRALALAARSRINGGRQPPVNEELFQKGPVKKFARRSLQNTPSERFLFLFSEVLLLCDEPKVLGQYNVKAEIKLLGTTLMEVPEEEGYRDVSDMCIRIRSRETSVDLLFSDPQTRDTWWNCISGQIEAEKKRKETFNPPNSVRFRDSGIDSTNMAPDWVKDEHTTMCALCHRKFLLFVRHRHHCRICGQIFCDECSKKKINDVRVCLEDYYKVHEDEKPDNARDMELLARTNRLAVKDKHKMRGYLEHAVYEKKLWQCQTRPVGRRSLDPAMAQQQLQSLATLPDIDLKSRLLLSDQQTLIVNYGLPNRTADLIGLTRHYAFLDNQGVFFIFREMRDTKEMRRLPLIGTTLIYRTSEFKFSSGRTSIRGSATKRFSCSNNSSTSAIPQTLRGLLGDLNPSIAGVVKDRRCFIIKPSSNDVFAYFFSATDEASRDKWLVGIREASANLLKPAETASKEQTK